MGHLNLTEKITAVVSGNQGVSQVNWGVDVITPQVPRGAVGRMLSMRGELIVFPTLLSNENLQMALIPALTIPTDYDEQVLARLKPLFVGYAGWAFEVGATDTANVVLQNPKIVVDIDFKGHKGAELGSQGPNSNNGIGWSLITRAPTASIVNDYFFTFEMEITYMTTSRSTSAIWSDDQIVEEESQ